MKITFSVPGQPRGQARPRFARIGRGVRTYKPKKDVQRENLVAMRYLEAAGNIAPHTGPIRLDVLAVSVPPKSWSRKRREEERYKTSRPDADNIGKLVADGLNEIAWRDDAQIVRLLVEKVFGDRDEVIVCIERI